MKKYLFISLFSVLFLTGGISAFADETTPVTPPATGETDTLIPVPEGPDTGETEPTIPVDPGTGETEDPTPITPDVPGEPVTPPTEPIGGGETESPIDPGTTPKEPGTTETPGEKTEPSVPQEPTTPTSEQPSDTPKEEPKQPEEKPTEEPTVQPKETQPTVPTKEVTVSVTPTGEITPNASQGTSVPIVTSDVKELTHIPTPTTPLKAASGQTIVGVKDGIPLVQDSQGNLIEDVSIPVKQLPSGNIEVTTANGQTKVLPKTGEETKAALSILGTLLTSIAGFFWYKRNKKTTENLK